MNTSSRGQKESSNYSLIGDLPRHSVVRCDAENRDTGAAILFVRDDI